MSPSLNVRENRAAACEIKFLVSPARAKQVLDWAQAQLAPDPNAAGDPGGSYPITSLYFDTAQFDVFQRCGSFGRGKYRIRRYGQSEVVFLERKLRTRRMLTKRRSLARLDELERLVGDKPESDWAGYWFHRRLLARRLRPVCQISYRRTARVAMTRHGPIRLTLDENLRAQAVKDLEFIEQEGEPLRPDSNESDHWTRPGDASCDQFILELKFCHEMPVLFKYLVEEFALNPRPISKYRLAVLGLELAPTQTRPLPETRHHEYA